MNKFLKKEAGVWSDYFGGMPSAAVLGALDPTGTVRSGVDIGGIIHGFSQPVDDKDIEAMDNNVGMGFVPGVATSRMIRRMRHNADKTGGDHPTANVVGETFGSAVPVLASTIAGAALGSIVRSLQAGATPEEVGKAGLIGAGIGGGLSGLATLGSFAAAGLTPRRTKAEQKDHDDSLNVQNWVVPGSAAYNYAKRFGRLLGEQNERKDKRKVKKSASALPKQASKAAWLAENGFFGPFGIAFKKYKENKANKAIQALARAALVGGTTYLGTGLLDSDSEYRGQRALAALLAAGGMGAYDLNNGIVDKSDYQTLWEGLKDRYNG